MNDQFFDVNSLALVALSEFWKFPFGRIFELFRRVGKLDQTGEGVGLAYARTVIRNVGGDITATSELDKGTTFRIVLPRELALNSSTIGSVLA